MVARIADGGAVVAAGFAAPFGRLDAATLQRLAIGAASLGVDEFRLSPWRALYVAVTCEKTRIGDHRDRRREQASSLTRTTRCSWSTPARVRPLVARRLSIPARQHGSWCRCCGNWAAARPTCRVAPRAVPAPNRLILCLSGLVIASVCCAMIRRGAARAPSCRRHPSPSCPSCSKLPRKPATMVASRSYIRDGAEIYRNSFAIIRAEADLQRFKGRAEKVAVRIIHATGMVEIAGDIAMSPDFAERAVVALAERRADPVRHADGCARHYAQPIAGGEPSGVHDRRCGGSGACAHAWERHARPPRWSCGGRIWLAPSSPSAMHRQRSSI